MTKKYWKDWQSKKDKTHQVEYWNYFLDTYRYSKWAIRIINGDKITDVQFHGDAVDITIERYDIEARLKADFEEAQSKVVSMTRKHGILLARVTDAESELSKAKNAIPAVETPLHDLNGNDTTVRELELKLKAAKDEYDEYDKRYKYNITEKERLEKELIAFNNEK